MSRYVNLDEEIKAMYFDEEHEEWHLKSITVESALNHVDYYKVFELIRCRECKHFDTLCWCYKLQHSVQGNGFCSWSERKEE